jgi:hypothetical protein
LPFVFGVARLGAVSFPSGSFRRFSLCLGLLAACAVAAQEPVRPRDDLGKIKVDTSPALFATLAILDQCNALEATESDTLRETIRGHVAANIQAQTESKRVLEQLCRFEAEHRTGDSAQNVAQYVSLALNLSGPPFTLKRKEADLPPDAANVLGFLSGLESLYGSAGLERIWTKNIPAYESRLQALHAPLSKMLFDTDLYLKLPISSYLGREFVIYIDPQLPVGLVNARNYSDDYYMAISPARVTAHLDEVRHTYLHYILDPLLLKRANVIKKLEPLKPLVASAPIAESYKLDATLLTTESLIRAIEARNLSAAGKSPKEAESERAALAKTAMEQGFVLTQHFYEQLLQFEKQPTGIRDAIGDLLYSIDIEREKKRAASTVFAKNMSSAETITSANSRTSLLDEAEERLAQSDISGAKSIAERVVREHTPGEDQGRAMFVLARAAVLSRDIDAAQAMFERSLESTKDARVIAWSHISLARIFDLKCVRTQAVSHYRAAMNAGANDQQLRSTAERGLQNTPSGCTEQESAR